jgi:polyisoprenyl-teichoic acid--peptidoglycan teichoic acid transferase
MSATPESLSPRRTRPRQTRRRRTLVRVGIALGIVLFLIGSIVAGGAVLYHNVVGRNLTTIPDAEVFPTGERPAPVSGAQNILLIGSDSRAAVDEADLETGGAQRSDVLMLVHVPADRKHVSVMSIMRDLWLPVPGHGDAKVNAALAWGGTPLTIQTVEDYLGVRIDHVAAIDFQGLADMTTALGGVYVDNPTAFTSTAVDRPEPHYFAQGPIKLQGETALSFVRERKAFPTADFQRVKNQQLLLKGIFDRAISRDVLGDPRQLTGFATEMSKNLAVDAGFTLPAMASLAYGLRGIDSRDISFFTVPTLGTGTSPDGQSIVKGDPAATERLRAALRADDLTGFERSLAAK